MSKSKKGRSWSRFDNDMDISSQDNYYGHDHDYSRKLDIDKALHNFFAQIKIYDGHRTHLEEAGGSLEDLQNIANTLSEPFKIETRYSNKTVKLADPEKLTYHMYDINHQLHLDVRRLPSNMPVYYLFRKKRDYWSSYPQIIADLYMSPGYPMEDLHFTKFMSNGKEIYAIRLSQFREATKSMLRDTDPDNASERAVDSLLNKVGQHIFQSAWHDDQRLSFKMAALPQLGLNRFREAVELLYLVLSAELCDLRNAIDEPTLAFFEKVYPQKPIKDVLSMVKDLDGTQLVELPDKAKPLYQDLGKSFSKYFATEIPWSNNKSTVPLWKIVYGNFDRLTPIGPALKTEVLDKRRENLEKTADMVIEEILNA